MLLLVQIGPLCINVGELRCRLWCVKRHGRSWVVFAGPLFSVAWWRGMRGLRVRAPYRP